ncbi:ATP-binding protein [Fundidesulfovibrio terrae]|uniref:ATP-binding protein n=1 Tax=Fundidesulfovibrio terrae TaxID=2922866 RepID=UPI001FAFF515|nr:ATP-binding protein [Fundidesulfovibrio terrae]
MKAVLSRLALLCAFLASASLCPAAESFSDKVLILHSYHAGFPWTDEIQSGIFTEFRRQDPHFEPFVEWLDWKRFPDPENLERAAESMLRKYAGVSFGVVIVSDNAALEFALKHRQSIFGGAPIVFCAINGYTDDMIAGQDRVSGVVEDVDAAGTLHAALSVLPETRRVIGLVEDTESGNAQKEDIRKAVERHFPGLAVSFPADPVLEDVFAACSGPSAKNTILLLGSFGRDRTGRIYPDFGVDLVSSGCATPVFVMWDFLVGKGAVGGQVLSGKLQGREAARIAQRFLAGEQNIPVDTKPPTQTMFDQEQLRRFRIGPGLLPQGSLLINEPVTIFQRYRELVPVVIVAMGLMAAAIGALSITILARKRVERELEKTKALLAAAIEHSPSGIMVAEAPQLTITLANPAAERILGIEFGREQPLGYLRDGDIPWKCFLPDGTLCSRSELPLAQTVLTGTSSDNVEMRVVRADGQERWILLSASPIRDRDERIIAGIIVFADITSRKHMEDMVVQSEKMMSLGGLAAGMAHEINNPLGIIVHSAQNALRRVSKDLPANAEAARKAGTSLEAVTAYLEARHILTYIQDVLDAGHRASRIVRSMLSFSRPRQSERSPLRLDTLMDKAVELAQSDYDIKRNYDIKKVRFERRYDPTGPSGFFVESEIVQVFLNIVKNAAQAMAAKSYRDGEAPVIRLTTSLAGDHVEAVIEDNGPGMDERTRKRVLEPFFTTKQVGEGTGLGLSVSYFIVTNSYGGTLDVRSRPGEGTAFTIRLPRGRV